MARVRIERTTDSHECDTCGFSMANGARIYVDDMFKADLAPIAHCFDGMTYDDDEIDRQVLRELGINVVYSTDPQYCRRLISSLGHELEIG